MLTVEECRQHLRDISLTDEEIERIRDCLYLISEKVLDKYFDGQQKKIE